MEEWQIHIRLMDTYLLSWIPVFIPEDATGCRTDICNPLAPLGLWGNSSRVLDGRAPVLWESFLPSRKIRVLDRRISVLWPFLPSFQESRQFPLRLSWDCRLPRIQVFRVSQSDYSCECTILYLSKGSPRFGKRWIQILWSLLKSLVSAADILDQLFLFLVHRLASFLSLFSAYFEFGSETFQIRGVWMSREVVWMLE